MKIKTEILNKLIGVAYKAAGNNKLIPITQMIGIKLENSELTLSATDSFNTLYIDNKVESSDESINVCVNADLISKLVSKFTCEFTELVLKENYLLVVGNGEYKLDLLLDDEGKAFRFPTKEISAEAKLQEIETAKIVDMKNYGEKSLAQTLDEPDLVAYFVNNEYAISTDRNIMTVINNGYTETPLTLRSKFVELLTNMKEKIKLSIWRNNTTGEVNLYATDDEIRLFSKVNGIVEDYPYEAIKNLVDTSEFSVKAKINVKELLAVLDRISLFVTPYDSNEISIHLASSKLYISSVKATGVEVVKLNDIDSEATWKGKIDIEMLASQLDTFTKDEIDIYFGDCIKLTENNVIKLICLCEE